MNNCKNLLIKKLSLISIIFILLLIPFTFSVSALDDSNNVGESDYMKYWTNTPSDNEYKQYYGHNTYNIQGKYNGVWKQTTCVDYGFRSYIVIDTSDKIRLEYMQNGVSKPITDDINVTLNASLVNEGKYVKIEYVVKNTSDLSHIISIGSGADIQIGNEDSAPITKFENGSGFKMVEDNTSDSAQFNFICKNAYGVTDVDTFWFGYYGLVDNYLFLQVEDNSYSDDSGMAYSWKDRTIPANTTQKYSVLFGIGAVNDAPVLTLTNPTETFGTLDKDNTVNIIGNVSDAENTTGTKVYYSIDNCEPVLAYTFEGVPGDFTAEINIPSDCSNGIHKINFFAQDKAGAISAAQTRTITISRVYTVSFNTNGGSNIVNIISSGKITEPTQPTKLGYTFAGWYKDSELTQEFDFANGKVTENITLYAKWNKNTVEVKETPKELKNTELITVKPDDGAFNQSIELKIKEDEEVQQTFQNVLKEEYNDKVILPLDISIYIKGTDTKVQPNEEKSVQITCPIPENLLPYKDSIKVACITDGKLDILDTKVVLIDGVYCVQFSAKHFSPYAILADKKENTDTDKSVSENSNTNTDKSVNKNSDININTEKNNIPDTGDNANLLSLSLFAVGSMVAVIGIKKKYKNN